MEYYYIYYGGFGAPFAISVGIFPVLIGNGVFAFLFPAFIIMAAYARPKRPEREEQFKMLPTRVLIFQQAAWLNDRTLGFLLRLRSSRKANSRNSSQRTTKSQNGAENSSSSVSSSRRRSESFKSEHPMSSNTADRSSPSSSSSRGTMAIVGASKDAKSLSASDVTVADFLPPGSDATQATDLMSKKHN